MVNCLYKVFSGSDGNGTGYSGLGRMPSADGDEDRDRRNHDGGDLI